jgi:hypothetical protein
MATDETAPLMSPTEWFDQFPSAFVGASGQWCARHWAPCPILGANGLGASTELMQIFINEIAKPGPPDALNAQMQAIGRVCCTLGDERMYQVWAHWPPTGPGRPA